MKPFSSELKQFRSIKKSQTLTKLGHNTKCDTDISLRRISDINTNNRRKSYVEVGKISQNPSIMNISSKTSEKRHSKKRKSRGKTEKVKDNFALIRQQDRLIHDFILYNLNQSINSVASDESSFDDAVAPKKTNSSNVLTSHVHNLIINNGIQKPLERRNNKVHTILPHFTPLMIKKLSNPTKKGFFLDKDKRNFDSIDDNKGMGSSLNSKANLLSTEKFQVNSRRQSIYNTNKQSSLKQQNKRTIRRKSKVKDSLTAEEEDTDKLPQPSYFVLQPNNLYKELWDIFVLILLIYILIFQPIAIAFIEKEPFPLKSFNIFVNSVYLFDIFFNFFIGYYDFEENLVMNYRLIAKNYLQTSFLIDFISGVPFDIILEIIIEENSSIKLINLTKILRLIKLSRLFKIVKTLKYLHEGISINGHSKPFEDISNDSTLNRFFQFFFYFILFTHISSCIWIFLSTLDSPNWIHNLEVDDSPLDIYIASLYFNFTTIFTVGYGDILSTNVYERSYNILLMMVGVCIFSFALSSLSSVIGQTDDRTLKFQQSMETLEEFKLKYRIKGPLYNKIKQFLKNDYILNKLDKKLVLNDLPTNLKNKLMQEIYYFPLNNLKFFKKSTLNFKYRAVTMLKSNRVYKGDYLIKEGDIIEDIYFIKKGSMNILKETKFGSVKIGEISKNDHFGDVYMNLNQSSPIDICVKSTSCDIFIMSKTDFTLLSDEFPKVIKNIIKKSLYITVKIEIIGREKSERLFRKNGITDINELAFLNASINQSRDMNSHGSNNTSSFRHQISNLNKDGNNMIKIINNEFEEISPNKTIPHLDPIIEENEPKTDIRAENVTVQRKQSPKVEELGSGSISNSQLNISDLNLNNKKYSSKMRMNANNKNSNNNLALQSTNLNTNYTNSSYYAISRGVSAANLVNNSVVYSRGVSNNLISLSKNQEQNITNNSVSNTSNLQKSDNSMINNPDLLSEGDPLDGEKFSPFDFLQNAYRSEEEKKLSEDKTFLNKATGTFKEEVEEFKNQGTVTTFKNNFFNNNVKIVLENPIMEESKVVSASSTDKLPNISNSLPNTSRETRTNKVNISYKINIKNNVNFQTDNRSHNTNESPSHFISSNDSNREQNLENSNATPPKFNNNKSSFFANTNKHFQQTSPLVLPQKHVQSEINIRSVVSGNQSKSQGELMEVPQQRTSFLNFTKKYDLPIKNSVNKDLYLRKRSSKDTTDFKMSKNNLFSQTIKKCFDVNESINLREAIVSKPSEEGFKKQHSTSNFFANPPQRSATMFHENISRKKTTINEPVKRGRKSERLPDHKDNLNLLYLTKKVPSEKKIDKMRKKSRRFYQQVINNLQSHAVFLKNPTNYFKVSLPDIIQKTVMSKMEDQDKRMEEMYNELKLAYRKKL